MAERRVFGRDLVSNEGIRQSHELSMDAYRGLMVVLGLPDSSRPLDVVGVKRFAKLLGAKLYDFLGISIAITTMATAPTIEERAAARKDIIDFAQGARDPGFRSRLPGTRESKTASMAMVKGDVHFAANYAVTLTELDGLATDIEERIASTDKTRLQTLTNQDIVARRYKSAASTSRKKVAVAAREEGRSRAASAELSARLTSGKDVTADSSVDRLIGQAAKAARNQSEALIAASLARSAARVSADAVQPIIHAQEVVTEGEALLIRILEAANAAFLAVVDGYLMDGAVALRAANAIAEEALGPYFDIIDARRQNFAEQMRALADEMAGSQTARLPQPGNE